MHEFWEDKLLFYTNGTLSDEECAELEAHLAECEICRAAVEEWADIAAAARRLAQIDPIVLPSLMPLPRLNSHRRHIPFITHQNKGEKAMITSVRPAWRKPLAVSLGTAAVVALIGIVLIWSFFMPDSRLAQVEYLRSPEEVNTSVFQQYVDQAWNAGNLEILDSLVAADIICHNPFMAEDAVGIEGLKGMITQFRSGLPDMQMTINSTIADENTVWAQVTLTGTQSASLELAPGTLFAASNDPVQLTQTIVARFEDGKIAEMWIETDRLALAQQLNLVPSLDQLAAEQQNMAIERRYVEEIWGSQETITAKDMSEFHTDCWVLHEAYESDPFGEPPTCGSQGDVSFINALKRAFSYEHTVTIDQLMAQGDIVIVHYTWRGVRSGRFGTIPPSNEEEQLDFTQVDRYENGKQVESWGYWIGPFIYEEAYGD